MIWGQKKGEIGDQSYLYCLRKNLFIFNKNNFKKFCRSAQTYKHSGKKRFSKDFLRKSFFLIYTEPLQTLMTSSALLAATSLAACTAILLASTAYT